MRVRDDLYLHVARPGEVPLDVAVGAPESGLGLPLGRLEGARPLRLPTDHPHPPATSTEGRFDGYGPAVRVAEVDHLSGPASERCVPGTGRDASLGGCLAAAYLGAHQLDRLGRRPHPGRSGLDDSPGEAGVLGQEPVARVNCVGTGARQDVDELFGRKVALRRAGPSQEVSLVGGPSRASPHGPPRSTRPPRRSPGPGRYARP